MKQLLVGLFLFGTAFTLADTVIMYDDGSTYTLKSNEDVYVSDDPLYRSVTIRAAQPNKKRDYVAPEPSDSDVCWPWAGIAPPPGHSLEACNEPEEEAESCPDGLGFGPGC